MNELNQMTAGWDWNLVGLIALVIIIWVGTKWLQSKVPPPSSPFGANPYTGEDAEEVRTKFTLAMREKKEVLK